MKGGENMLYPLQHKATLFAGMYAGVMDKAYSNIGNFADNMSLEGATKEEVFKQLKSRFVGYNPKTSYAEKQPVLPIVGYVSRIPNIVSYVGPGYAVVQTEQNGHKITSDIPTATLAARLTSESKAAGINTTINVVNEGSIYPYE